MNSSVIVHSSVLLPGLKVNVMVATQTAHALNYQHPAVLRISMTVWTSRLTPVPLTIINAHPGHV